MQHIIWETDVAIVARGSLVLMSKLPSCSVIFVVFHLPHTMGVGLFAAIIGSCFARLSESPNLAAASPVPAI